MWIRTDAIVKSEPIITSNVSPWGAGEFTVESFPAVKFTQPNVRAFGFILPWVITLLDQTLDPQNIFLKFFKIFMYQKFHEDRMHMGVN